MLKFVNNLIFGQPQEEEIPEEVYRSVPLLPAESEMYYPIVMDEEKLYFFKKTRKEIIKYPIQFEDDILFVKPTKKVFSKDIDSTLTFISSSTVSVQTISLDELNPKCHLQTIVKRGETLHRSVKKLLAMYLQMKFNDIFVFHGKTNKIVWKFTSEAKKEDVIQYLNSMVFEKYNGETSTHIEDEDGVIYLLKNGFIKKEHIDQPHKFVVQVKPVITFILRKFHDMIMNDLKMYCIHPVYEDEMKGIYQSGKGNIDFETINKDCENMFNQCIDKYVIQIKESQIMSSFDHSYVVDLCKAFNVIYKDEAVSIRYMKPKDPSYPSVNIFFVRMEDGEKYIGKTKEMNKNHMAFNMNEFNFNEEQKKYFILKGVVFDDKKQIFHCFTLDVIEEIKKFKSNIISLN